VTWQSFGNSTPHRPVPGFTSDEEGIVDIISLEVAFLCAFSGTLVTQWQTGVIGTYRPDMLRFSGHQVYKCQVAGCQIQRLLLIPCLHLSILRGKAKLLESLLVRLFAFDG
jgi:hypothetical protein